MNKLQDQGLYKSETQTYLSKVAYGWSKTPAYGTVPVMEAIQQGPHEFTCKGKWN